MVRRFGGSFSPSDVPRAGAARPGDSPPKRDWTDKRRRRAGARVNALFWAPAPLLIMAFGRDPLGLALNLAAFGLLMAAAFMTREGVRAEEAFDARKVAKRPALPRKLLGSLLTGGGLALAGAGAGDLLTPAIFAILGVVLHVMAFGPDPLRDKGGGLDSAQTDRVARAVDGAEAHLAAMREAVAPLHDRDLEARVERFQATARGMFRRVEDDPRDLAGARRWLGVYLLGARDATIKFAALYARRRDAGARDDYLAFLDDLEQGFTARTDRMLLDDRTDLDIEIEVLRDRLVREGVLERPET